MGNSRNEVSSRGGYLMLLVIVGGFVIKVNAKIRSGIEPSLENGKEKDDDKGEDLNELIKQVDEDGLLERLMTRRIHIPKHSSLAFTSQVSRPNIFPNIFRQREGFIVDAVVEWPIWLNLHKFADAMYNDEVKHEDKDRSEFPEDDGTQTQDKEQEDDDTKESSRSHSISGIAGVERCLIYDKIETGMSLYLEISRNQSRDCLLRAVCEAQLLADYYPVAPSSVFFEVIHLILTPSLGKDACHEEYVRAEQAANIVPEHCSQYVSKCPLNIAALFVRNFFPEI